MLGCISLRAAIKKKTNATSTPFLLTLLGGFHLMLFVAFVDSGDIFLKPYVVFWGRVPSHWLKLQSLRDNFFWEGAVLEEAHRRGDFWRKLEPQPPSFFPAF